MNPHADTCFSRNYFTFLQILSSRLVSSFRGEDKWRRKLNNFNFDVDRSLIPRTGCITLLVEAAGVSLDREFCCGERERDRAVRRGAGVGQDSLLECK